MGMLRKFQPILSRSCLLTLHKACISIRSHLDYADIMYDQVYNPLFMKNLNIYNMVCLAISGAIGDT